MGKSSSEGKDIILNWVRELELLTVLDIGAGSGTYRKMFIKNRLQNTAQWTAIEAWQPYIDNFKLTELYSTVINDDVRNVNIASLGQCDIVFMGDVLEHISKQDAIELVDKVMAVAKCAVISIPIVHWPQSDLHGNPFEVHVKDDWSDAEVTATFSKYISRSHQGTNIGVYWLETK
jgi:phospholipid N-methyltransferase